MLADALGFVKFFRKMLDIVGLLNPLDSRVVVDEMGVGLSVALQRLGHAQKFAHFKLEMGRILN